MAILPYMITGVGIRLGWSEPAPTGKAISIEKSQACLAVTETPYKEDIYQLHFQHRYHIYTKSRHLFKINLAHSNPYFQLPFSLFIIHCKTIESVTKPKSIGLVTSFVVEGNLSANEHKMEDSVDAKVIKYFQLMSVCHS